MYDDDNDIDDGNDDDTGGVAVDCKHDYDDDDDSDKIKKNDHKILQTTNFT